MLEAPPPAEHCPNDLYLNRIARTMGMRWGSFYKSRKYPTLLGSHPCRTLDLLRGAYPASKWAWCAKRL